MQRRQRVAAWFEAGVETLLVNAAQPEDETRHAQMLREPTEILTAHHRLGANHVLRAQHTAKHVGAEVRQRRIVKRGRRKFVLADDHVWILRTTQRPTGVDRHLADGVEQQATRPLAVRANRNLQLGLVGDDIVFRPGVDRADGDDG